MGKTETGGVFTHELLLQTNNDKHFGLILMTEVYDK